MTAGGGLRGAPGDSSQGQPPSQELDVLVAPGMTGLGSGIGVTQES